MKNKETLSAVIGGVFVIETLTVIIQIFSVVVLKKRVFLMTPIHHHFELGGWSEIRVVFTFWTVGLISGLIGVLLAI